MRVLIAAVAAVGLLAVGCSSGDGASAAGSGSDSGPPFELSAAAVQTSDVTLPRSYKFEPQVIEVSPATEVTWTNEDNFPHNVQFLDGSDMMKDLAIGVSASITFDEPGDYYYECSIHPQQMRGKVIVTNDS
jgi:plastocyanin